MFVPDCYKNQNNKTADNYPYALEFIPDCFKTQKMCKKAVDTSAIQIVPKCYKTQEMCVETVGTCPFVFDSVPDQCKIKLISKILLY